MYSLVFLNRRYNVLERAVGIGSMEEASILADTIRAKTSPRRWFPHLIIQDDLPNYEERITIFANEVAYEAIP